MERGRKSAVEKSKQKEVYEKYKSEIFTLDGKLLGVENKIYNVLTEELLGMSKKAIYLSIQRIYNVP